MHRPLAGCVINLSISESDDSVKKGFPEWQTNRITLQMVAALFGQGASIVFGHDWRENGVMEAVYGFARQVQAPIPLTAEKAEAEGQALLRNLIPWPDSPYLSESDLERLSSTLRVEPAGLPLELQAFDMEARQSDPSGPLYRYLRARGLTFLRRRLNDICHVRLCLGGRRSGSSGRYPGVIEEALMTIQANKPLYVASLLGGAAEQVVDAIEGKPINGSFCPDTPVSMLYQRPPVTESNPETMTDRMIDRVGVWREFAKMGPQRLAGLAGLTIEENQELFHSTVVDRVIELILIGLSRRWSDLAWAGREY
jgi:hypothetical protein